MRLYRVAAFALALCAGAALTQAARADSLVTSRIGRSSCGKLGPDLKPGAGFNHMPNALLFYWAQGYMSAANIFLLTEYTDYVDSAPSRNQRSSSSSPTFAWLTRTSS
jgi:hypothetical protein